MLYERRAAHICFACMLHNVLSQLYVRHLKCIECVRVHLHDMTCLRELIDYREGDALCVSQTLIEKFREMCDIILYPYTGLGSIT